MQKGEFKFMMNKLCLAIGVTIQIKKNFLVELMRNIDNKLLAKNKDFLYKADFLKLMSTSLKELNDRVTDLAAKQKLLELQVKLDRLPDFMRPGNLFLGQFQI